MPPSVTDLLPYCIGPIVSLACRAVKYLPRCLHVLPVSAMPACYISLLSSVRLTASIVCLSSADRRRPACCLSSSGYLSPSLPATSPACHPLSEKNPSEFCPHILAYLRPSSACRCACCIRSITHGCYPAASPASIWSITYFPSPVFRRAGVLACHRWCLLSSALHAGAYLLLSSSMSGVSIICLTSAVLLKFFCICS